MRPRPNAHERQDFARYLRQCTDAQVQGVYEKERGAKRYVFANLAAAEAGRRMAARVVNTRTFRGTPITAADMLAIELEIAAQDNDHRRALMRKHREQGI